MSIRLLKFASIVSMLFVSLPLFAPSAEQLRRPISLDKIDNGDLYALDSSGTVFRIAVSGEGLAIKNSFSLPATAYPTDVVSANLYNHLTLLISANSQLLGYVYQYSVEGKVEQFWSFRNAIAGLDVDAKSHVLYIAISQTSEIYQINLQPSKQAGASYIGVVPRAKQLGPLVFDVIGKDRLLLGDVGDGQIFEFNLKTRKSRVFASNVGSPQALLISAASNVLYVADALHRKIYLVDLKQENAAPKVFAALREFRSPSGLARLEDGRLIVSDDEAGALFVLSKTGTLQFTFKH